MITISAPHWRGPKQLSTHSCPHTILIGHVHWLGAAAEAGCGRHGLFRAPPRSSLQGGALQGSALQGGALRAKTASGGESMALTRAVLAMVFVMVCLSWCLFVCLWRQHAA